MLGASAAIFLVLATSQSDPTIWWRTQGAQVAETQDEAGRTCALVIDAGGGSTAVATWKHDGGHSLYVRSADWHFGNRERERPVQLELGGLSLSGAAGQITAVEYQDWVLLRLDQPIADALGNATALHVSFPQHDAPEATIALDRTRMGNVIRAVRRCQQAIGWAQ